MNEVLLGVALVFVIMFLVMFLGVPIGWSMLVGGLVGFACMGIFNRGLYLTSYTAWSLSTSESLICIPLYLLMGNFLLLSGMTSKLFEFAMSILSRFKVKGGLAMATVVACAFFGAVSGSIAAAISAMGPVVMPEAEKYKYNKNFLAGTLATAGALASLIPPSLNLIMFGILTETSIAKLFAAGIVPGILLSIIYCIAVYFMVKRNPALAPTILAPMSWRQTGRTALANTPIVIIILLVLGGIYLGWFTPTESAGVGAGAVLVVALSMRKLKMKEFVNSFLDVGRIFGMIFVLLLGAFVVSGYLSTTQSISAVAQVIAGFDLNKYTFLLLVWILYFILGCPISSLCILVLTIPVFFPISVELGVDPLVFGIFCNLAAEVAEVSPPIGLNIFTMQGIANDPEVTTVGMFNNIWFFIIGVHVLVILLVLFPEIATWLPSTMN